MATGNSRHRHELVWFTPGERYKCSGCKEEGGNGGFRCTHQSCADFRLHNECYQLPDVYQKSIHVHEELTFRPRTKIPHHNCSACKHTIEGFLFKIPRRLRSRNLMSPSLRFHPLCITLPESLTCRKHENHSLKLVKVEDGYYTCGFCNKRSQGWRYACQWCVFTLGLTCAKLDMQGLLEHPSQDQATPQEGNRTDFLHAAGNFFGRVATGIVSGATEALIGDAIE